MGEAGHRQQRTDVSQVLVITDAHRCPADCDLIALAHFIPRTISHPDLERDPFVYRGLDLVTGHRSRLPLCLEGAMRASGANAGGFICDPPPHPSPLPQGGEGLGWPACC